MPAMKASGSSPGPEWSRRFRLRSESCLAAVWALIERPAPYVRPFSPAPSDNVQRAMNLVMPLRFRSVAGRAEVAQRLFEATDEILVGLNNVGTVHFARFDVIRGNLCMISVYDGGFDAYIRDFIATIGDAFDVVMSLVKDPPPLPCAQNVDAFLAWVAAHDALQLAEHPTDLSPTDLGLIGRRTLLQLRRRPDVCFGLYRAYPGFSAAQIRQHLDIGW
ncbi:MAG: hypothetical protein M3N98_00815 [Actinomycetota bacterium]|nr:hypothetical protein [Actinomycetota bacterium]